MSNYNKYPKGSEWRKWDLHFHSPSSYDYEDKSVTNEDIINGLIEHNISVVAITDHHLIDVERISKLQDLAENKVTILPGIEFLCESRGKDPIHFIAIFSENSKIQFIWDQIKNNTNIKRIYGEGKKTNDVYCDLDKTTNLIHQLGGLVSIHAGSKSNTIDNITHALPHGVAQKEDIAKSVDIFELGKEDDVEPYTKFVNHHLSTSINKVLPLVICSDNHNIRDYKSKQNLWIKADPTFQGLKQLIYEPLDRASISDSAPDDKFLYHLIDKVKFQDNSFTTEEIQINQNLTTIIGGKSTGKSILLRNIAKSIDVDEYKKRLKSVNLNEPRRIEGMEVAWKDGQVSSLDAGDNPNKRIIYIPQSYLNRVVDNDKEYTDIDQIIKEVLLQDEDFHEWHLKLSVNEKAINDNIEQGIRVLFENIKIRNECNDELKKIGDEKGIQQQIMKIKGEIEELQKKLDLSDEKIKEYNEKIEKIKGDRITISISEDDIANLKILKEVSVSIYNPDEFSFKSEDLTAKIDELRRSKTVSYSKDWKSEIERLIEIEEKQLEDKRKRNQKEIAEVRPLQAKIDDQKNLTKKYNELEEEQKKDRIIKNLKIKIEDSLKKIKEVINNLCDEASNYYSIYLNAKDKIDFDNMDEELIFDIETVFQSEKFYQNFIDSYFDGRKIRTSDYDFITKFQFQSKEKYKDFLEKVIWSILRNELPVLSNGVNNRELITALLKNWFLHSYRVEYDGDQINEMSPGKKSFVLLRLLVDLDNSNCPILIDQPEDDLDNRSIYYEVVEFLRKKKTNRQIIIATHNPNLVLGADAELVIVANQQGKKSKNKKNTFEYVSGAIEHSFAENDKIQEILFKRGVQEHICEVLEGGKEAFNKRMNKYSFK